MKLLVSILLISFIGLCAAVHNLEERYPFRAILLDRNDQYYALYWNFTRSTESIYFAVNVSTTGWVGFGLSPTGSMVGSDVVIGWVDGENSYFHDRYAEAQVLPPIDSSQDWFLISSEEANGFTVLEFSRNFTTCDTRDLDITTSTDRVVWSFGTSDPTSPVGQGGPQYHENRRGSISLNLLGGLPSPQNPVPSDQESVLEIRVSNVTIPNVDTTYWCASSRLPSDLINSTGFITRISPVITQVELVHHILVYVCVNPLDESNVDASEPCYLIDRQVSACRGLAGILVAAWAVGGEDFVYPEGIAYPIGGTQQETYVVIEMHYNNQELLSGEIDNSGLRFFYTMTEPEQRAGIMFLGHDVTPLMVIPPGTRNYTVSGICTAQCTNRFIPPEGIRLFGNALHTHVAGRKVTLQQFRPTECGVFEEIEPIDQNLNYDFNFQQATHFARERVVLPGDILVLNCEYDTTTRSEFTTGGESTLEEMCLTFPIFYPRATDGSSLVSCISTAIPQTSFNDFIAYLSNVNPEAVGMILSNPDETLSVLNTLDWTGSPELARRLQDSVHNSTNGGYCGPEVGEGMQVSVPPVNNPCPYTAPDRCSDSNDAMEALSCCERLVSTPSTTDSDNMTAGTVQTNVTVLGSVVLFLCVAMAAIF